MESIKDVLNTLDDITGRLGGEEEDNITNITSDIVLIKEHLLSVDGQIQDLTDNLESANKRALDLQGANNKLMRRITVQEENKENEEFKEEDELVEQLSGLL